MMLKPDLILLLLGVAAIALACLWVTFLVDRASEKRHAAQLDQWTSHLRPRR